MGHAFQTFRDRSIHLHDTWIETLRGLIVRHARPPETMRAAFDEFVGDWGRLGPGVWSGGAFRSFVDGPEAEARRVMLVEAIVAARDEVVAQGEELSVAFLDAIPQHEEYGTGGFGGPVPATKVLSALDQALGLLRA